MDVQEVLRRCEGNISLFEATDEDLAAAQLAATRAIHHHILDQECARRAKWARRQKRLKKQQGRPSRREDPFDKAVGIILGTHDEFGRRIKREGSVVPVAGAARPPLPMRRVQFAARAERGGEDMPMKVLHVEFGVSHGEKQKQALQVVKDWIRADPGFGSHAWDKEAMLGSSTIAELVYAANSWAAQENGTDGRTDIVGRVHEGEGGGRRYHYDEELFALLAPYACEGDSVCVQIGGGRDMTLWYVARFVGGTGAPLALFEKDVDAVPTVMPTDGKLVALRNPATPGRPSEGAEVPGTPL